MTALAAVSLLVVGALGGPPHFELEGAAQILARARAAEAHSGMLLLELRPTARLLGHAPRWDVLGEYQPRLFLGLRLGEVQHRAQLSATFDVARGLLLRFAHRTFYGYEDFALVEPASRLWSLELRPSPLRSFLQSVTEAGAELQLAPLVSLSATAGFAINGPLERDEQLRYPLQRGPFLGATVAWSVTRRDLLLTQLWSSFSVITGGRTATAVRLWEVWRRDLSRSTRLDLGLGLGGTMRTQVRALGRYAVQPVANAAVLHRTRWGRQDLELSAQARFTNYLNPTTGEVYPRTEATASADLWLPGRARWVGRTGAAAEFGATTGTAERLLLAETQLHLPLRRTSHVVFGALGAAQQLPREGAGPNFQWTAYILVATDTDAL